MHKVVVSFACLGLAASFGCGNPSGPRSGLNIVSGAGLSDTVGSTLKPPLTVQLLDGDLQPLSGQTVYFNTDGPVLVAPLDEPGFGINRLPGITDASGEASVWVELLFAAGPGKVVVVAPSGQSVELHYTVLPGAPAYVRADPRDTVLYVGGSETFRPFITDAYGDRRPDVPSYQYVSLSGALSISAPGKATGTAIGRGSVGISALGFTDTVWASVVPKGRLAVQRGYIVVLNLDGSAVDTLPGLLAGATLDWSAANGTLVSQWGGPGYIVSIDMTGHTRRVVTDPLMRSEFYPRYSHDGSYIYFTGNDSVTTCYGVWRIHPDGTAIEHVVADTSDCGIYAYLGGPSPDYASSPSPDGMRLVYVGGTGIPYVGGILRVHTLASGADTSLGVVGDVPRWSPTGEWIAYDSTGMLMLIHPDGTGHQALLYRGYYTQPAVSWSPDGQWLVYNDPDRPELVQVATGLKLPLATTIGLADPTWQP
jgi:hypothetical protein